MLIHLSNVCVGVTSAVVLGTAVGVALVRAPGSG